MSSELTGLLWIGPPLVLLILSNLLFGTDPGPRNVMRLALVVSAVEVAIWLVASLWFGEFFYWAFLVQWLLMGGFALWNIRRLPT